ncbi:MAG TPA: hypothetical protein PKN86_07315 [Candidatus Obscuribacter sp.]|nr:hypothetical protein [Candidatus Obscuribacter sp.]HNM49492.1 hypothetical protein [Candidatus Obscuribacter sp.]HNN63194.1 hypothetical protein [Candidatus Obscuribacter sp.]
MLNAQDRSLRLSNLAEVEMKKSNHLSRKCFYKKLLPSQFAEALLPLAREATDLRNPSDEQILPIFFTDEACELLMKLPNLYWFWHVLEKAYEWQLDGYEERIDVATVLRAMGELREKAPRAWVVCKLPPESLSPGALVARTAHGVFLTGADETVVRNIIFSTEFTPNYR